MIPVKRIAAEKRTIVVPLLIALAANVVLYAVAVYPLARRVGSAEQRANVARSARQAAEREQNAARATLEGKDRADRELKKFYADVLPADQAAARRITYLRLDRFAREAGLDPGHTRFTPKEVRDSSLTELDTTVELEGDYRAVRRFLYLLETAPEFTIIQNVALSSTEEGPLRLTLSLVTYFRTGSDGD
jgi:hypothetical protein